MQDEYSEQDDFIVREGITGIWIPGEVAFNPELKNSERMIFWLISSLCAGSKGVCFATNNYIAERLDLKPNTVSVGISELRDQGYIKVKISEKLGNKRIITIDKEGMKRHEYHILNYNQQERGYMMSTREGVYDVNQIPSMTQIKSYYKDTITKSKEIKNNDSLLRNESVTKPAVLSIDSLFSSYSKQAKDLFEYFDSFCDILPRVLLKESNTFHKAMQDIENALSRGFKPDEIATAMTHYYNLVSNGTTKFKKTKGTTLVGLDGFFGWNKYIKDRAGEKSIIAKIKSWFDEALKGEEYLTKTYCMNNQYEHDILPEVTNVIRSNWIKSPYHAGELTVWDENNFRKATKMLVKWLDKKGDGYNFSSRYIEYPEEFVPKYLFPAIKNHLGKRDPKEITTNYLANQDMFERWLHVYLKKLGLYNGGSESGRDGLYSPED